MALDLEMLGLSKEELQNRVVEAMVERLMSTTYYDDNGDPVTRDARFTNAAMAEIKRRIDTKMEDLGARIIAPNLSGMIESIVIQPTNNYGEKKGTPKTLIEYITEQASAYLNTQVDKDGKPRASQDSYSWSAHGTRAAWLAHQELQGSILKAMNDVLTGTNQTLGQAIAEAVKVTVDRFRTNFTVSTTTKQV